MSARAATVPKNPKSDAAPALDDSSRPTADLRGVWGERIRRLALGALAALIVSRFFWPSDAPPGGSDDAISAQWHGLVWVACALAVTLIGLVGNALAGTLRIRFGLADAGLVALAVLVGLSASAAPDRRPAINLAWEWGGLLLTFLMVRWLPRDRRETHALVAALIASAAAVSVYGLYQVGVEFPQTRAFYRANPERVLKLVGIAAGTPAQQAFEDRLLGSTEPIATFALANSLAGFLLIPAVVLIGLIVGRLADRRARLPGPGWLSWLLALLPALAILLCLLLTKSRGAYVGLAVGGLVVLATQARSVSVKTLLTFGGVGLGLIVAIIALLASVGALDRLVLTESSKSLRYRAEYWTATWQVINDDATTYWRGLGPGNFPGPYLRHKLETSSEEIKDPHNFVLDVWAMAGLPALLCLLASAAVGVIAMFRTPDSAASADANWREAVGRTRWLTVMAGLGGWILAAVVGDLDPFVGDGLNRWLILGAAWWWASGLGRGEWRGGRLSSSMLAAALIAWLVHLLAAGGIGMPAVALAGWTAMAAGLNLCDPHRGCGRLREIPGVAATFAIAAVWAALAGTFVGAVGPFWRSEAALARSQAAGDDLDAAREAIVDAIEADAFSPRPFQALAGLEFRAWVKEGSPIERPVWEKVLFALDKAIEPPRNPNDWTIERQRAIVARDALTRFESQIPLKEVLKLRAKVVEGYRKASRLYPANATLRAELAIASADLGMHGDAVKEAEEALRLDQVTSHAGKKLDPALKRRIEANQPGWRELRDHPPQPPREGEKPPVGPPAPGSNTNP